MYKWRDRTAKKFGEKFDLPSDFLAFVEHRSFCFSLSSPPPFLQSPRNHARATRRKRREGEAMK